MYVDTFTSLGIILACFAVAGWIVFWEMKNARKPSPQETTKKSASKLYRLVRKIHMDDDRSVAVFIGEGSNIVGKSTMDRLHKLLEKAIDRPFISEFRPETMQVCAVDGWIVRDVHFRRKTNFLFGGSVAYYVRFELERVGNKDSLDIRQETVLTPLQPQRCVKTLPVVRKFRSAGDIKL